MRCLLNLQVSDRGEFIIRAENLYGVTEEIVFLNVQPAPREVKPKLIMQLSIIINININIIIIGQAVPA